LSILSGTRTPRSGGQDSPRQVAHRCCRRRGRPAPQHSPEQRRVL